MPKLRVSDLAEGTDSLRPPFDDIDSDAAPLAVLEADAAATLEELRAEARQAADEARAASTERAYAADWRDFSAFCARIGRGRAPRRA